MNPLDFSRQHGDHHSLVAQVASSYSKSPHAGEKLAKKFDAVLSAFSGSPYAGHAAEIAARFPEKDAEGIVALACQRIKKDIAKATAERDELREKMFSAAAAQVPTLLECFDLDEAARFLASHLAIFADQDHARSFILKRA